MNAQDLKNSILQLAMQGKLVSQKDNDNSSNCLLEKIKNERAKLIKEKKIKNNIKHSLIYKKDNHYYEKIGKKQPNCIDEEIPFDIPNNWEWVRLDNIVKISTGKKDANHGTENGKYIFFTCSKEQIRSSTYSYEGECLLLPGNGANVGLVIYYDGKFEVYQRTYVLEKFIKDFNMQYLKFAMDLSWKKYNSDKMYGSAIPYIKLGNLKNYLVPLPPLQEQKRIVAKIKKILPLIDEYGINKEQLDKINSELPTKLKSSILQEAVQGKLVPQDSADEPASVILENINQEKEQLIKAKKIKKNNKESVIFKEDGHYYEQVGKKESICIDDDLPFDIPDSWEWVRLGLISFITKLAGFEYSKYISPNVQSDGIPLLKAKNIKNDCLIGNFDSYISKDLSDQLIRSKVNKKCILTPYVGASIGNAVIFDNSFEAHLAPNLAKIELYGSIMEEYLFRYIKSPEGYKELTKYLKSTAQPSISMKALRDMLIPLPPFNEQKRIVDKIEQLFENVDVLIDGECYESS